MSDAQASLDVARADLGYSERPAGSNRTKFGQWFGLDGQPWCDMAQSYWADRAGNGSIVGRFAYTPSHAAWFQARGQWHTTPAVGDLVFFNFGAGRIHHVGIVEAVRADGIVTIEGNTSAGSNANGGQVQRRFRSWSVGIVGYGRPAYTAPRPTPLSGPEKLYIWLKAGALAATKPFLRPGSENDPAKVDDIKAAQQLLGLPQTGVYGPAVVDKVAAFQAFLQIPHRGPAGRMNRRTWQWLIYDAATRGRR